MKTPRKRTTVTMAAGDDELQVFEITAASVRLEHDIGPGVTAL